MKLKSIDNKVLALHPSRSVNQSKINSWVDFIGEIFHELSSDEHGEFTAKSNIHEREFIAIMNMFESEFGYIPRRNVQNAFFVIDDENKFIVYRDFTFRSAREFVQNYLWGMH